jgi:hypothetical protein
LYQTTVFNCRWIEVDDLKRCRFNGATPLVWNVDCENVELKTGHSIDVKYPERHSYALKIDSRLGRSAVVIFADLSTVVLW